MTLEKGQEQQDWIGRVFSIIKVECDFCGKEMEVASDAEPNDNGLWKCPECIDENVNLW